MRWMAWTWWAYAPRPSQPACWMRDPTRAIASASAPNQVDLAHAAASVHRVFNAPSQHRSWWNW